MPYNKRGTKGRKKRTPTKSKYPKRSIVTVPRNALGFPDTYRAKLKYTEAQSIVVPYSTGQIVQTFNLNGLYDPNETGTGHQPRYFDQLMALYENYRVSGCKVRLSVFNTGSQNPVYTCCLPSIQTAPTEQAWAVSELDDSGPLVTVGSEGSAPNPFVWNKYYSIHDVLGQPKGAASLLANNQGSASANPGVPAYLHIVYSSVSGSDVTLKVVTELTYYATFEKQKVVAQS